MAALLSFLAGCFTKAGTSAPPSGSAASALREKPGELAGVIRETSGGSMAWRSEFEIEVTEEEVVRCAYWPDDAERDMVRKEHVPVTSEQWADIEAIVDTLFPLLEEVPAGKDPEALPPGVTVLDGGDYDRLSLVWRTAEGDRTVRYYRPADRRVTTLDALLRELADPQGREIVWYDPPVLCGVYFRDETQDVSCQCTEWDGPDTGYRYIAHFPENGERLSVDQHVGAAAWEAAKAFCEPLALEQFPAGTYENKITCTLYYSDHTQKCVKPDAAAAAALRESFAALTRTVRAGGSAWKEEETMNEPALDGAWEPKGYLGPRVEISGNELVRLWRGAPVLQTTFTAEKTENGYLLQLAETRLRHVPGGEPYAEIRECRYENGALTLVDEFPITGESTDTLYPTQNNRYGNYEIVSDEVLPRLAGTWKEEGGSLRMRLEGDRLFFGYVDGPDDSVEVVALRSGGDQTVSLHDVDPSLDGVGMFGRITVQDDGLHTYLPICDAPSAEIVFRRED